MKKCPYCGKEYPDESSFCASDGQPLQPVVPAPSATAPPPVGERQRIIDGEHIKLLSVFHFVVAGLALVGVGFLLVHYLLMRTVFANPDLFKGQPNAPQLPKDFFKMFIWFYIFMGAVFLSACILNLLSGFFLRQRRHRTFSMVVGGLNCLQIPFGTVLGIFTIIVLSRPSVRETYAD